MPVLPLPEKSVAVLPLPSSNDQQPTNPRLFGGLDITAACAEGATGDKSATCASGSLSLTGWSRGKIIHRIYYANQIQQK
ncbi:MAG: hypothetical protein COU11_01470 [Candidatus Harrisonbacteria bacterium CG10_big_fil_rev_8_21_14_0_10_49_15]|uniref:Uncharacterized protein n=1 Tax=Candidatus Harrisonbacteria bacterium CG10_big_fil_rev_8_21_14_0_10_49_15 TaxID=1974587 RepID=A0A2H0UN63_9BACT|nr:MAG: hypothetical protein COU11_01470 [Candidatus Harrisonbacteria bacterium CG10_big_fil_rev_8_21_14_0_10_49_15]